MKKQENVRRVTREVIDSLLYAGDSWLRWMANPRQFNRELRGHMSQDEWDRLFADKRHKRALKKLREKQWLKDRHEGNRVEFSLQNEAIAKSIQAAIRKNKAALPDQAVTLVTFDFPEAAKSARAAFRNVLKRIGFTRKHLSVWVSKYDVGVQIRQLIRLMRVEKWVKVYLAQEPRSH